METAKTPDLRESNKKSRVPRLLSVKKGTAETRLTEKGSEEKGIRGKAKEEPEKKPSLSRRYGVE